MNRRTFLRSLGIATAAAVTVAPMHEEATQATTPPDVVEDRRFQSLDIDAAPNRSLFIGSGGYDAPSLPVDCVNIFVANGGLWLRYDDKNIQLGA